MPQPAVPTHPYAPPRIPAYAPPPRSTDLPWLPGIELANPLARLFARLVDLIAQFAPPCLAFIPGAVGLDQGLTNAIVIGVLLYTIALPFAQALLISSTGATLGKKLMGIKMIRSDGSQVGFVDGWLVRSFIFGIVELIANLILLGVPGLVDALMVFTRRGQTLHDHVAGTYVIKAHSAAGSM